MSVDAAPLVWRAGGGAYRGVIAVDGGVGEVARVGRNRSEAIGPCIDVIVPMLVRARGAREARNEEDRDRRGYARKAGTHALADAIARPRVGRPRGALHAAVPSVEAIMKITTSILAALATTFVATVASAQANDEPPVAPPAQPTNTVGQPSPDARRAQSGPVVVVEGSHSHHDSMLDRRYRSPGIAALLSLAPVPVDFGNFYAENVTWGIVYTSGELALAGSMMWLGGMHMCHAGSDCSGLSDGETVAMIAMAGGYAAVKIVAALHAASAARTFDAQQPQWAFGVSPVRGGAATAFTLRF